MHTLLTRDEEKPEKYLRCAVKSSFVTADFVHKIAVKCREILQFHR